MRVPDIVFHPCREPSPERLSKQTVYRTGIRISLTPPPLRRHPPPAPPPPRRTRSADSRRHRPDSGGSSSGSSFGSFGSSGASSGGDFVGFSRDGFSGGSSGGSESEASDRECPWTPPRPRSGKLNRSRPASDIERESEGTPTWKDTLDTDSQPKRDNRDTGPRSEHAPESEPLPDPRPATSGVRIGGAPQRRPSRPPPPPPVRCFSVDVQEGEGEPVQPERCRPRSWAGVEVKTDLLDSPRLLIGLPSEEDVR